MSWPHYVTFPSIWFTWSNKPIGELERGKETLSNCQLNYVRKMWREIFCSCCLFVFGHRNSGNHSYWHFKLDASCFYLCLEVCFFCGSYYGVHVVAYFSQGNIRCGSDHLCSSSFLSLCLWKKKKNHRLENSSDNKCQEGCILLFVTHQSLNEKCYCFLTDP